MIARFNLEPFASASFQKYFISSALAAGALSIFQPAIDWIVLTRNGLAADVALVDTTLIVAVALATLPGGALTDRYGARRMLTIALAAMSALIVVVAVVGALDLLTFEVALVLAFAVGIFDGLWAVAAWVVLPLSVKPSLLGSAIGLTALTGGLGRLLGGPFGGGMLQVAGPAQAFIPSAIALAASALVISRMHLLGDGEGRRRPGRLSGLRDALRWLASERLVLAVILLSMLGAATIGSYGTLLPAFTRNELDAGSATLGLLTGAGGIGSIVGALMLEAIGRRAGRGRWVVVAFLGMGLAVGALGLAHVLPVALALIATITFLAVGFGGTVQLLVQTMAPAHLRAGVVAVWVFAPYCVLPIATATVGRLADAFGVGTVLITMAAAALIGTGIIVLLLGRIWTLDVDRQGRVVRDGSTVAPEEDLR